MNNIAKISCVRSPAFRSLLVGEHFDKREVIYRSTVTAHFQPGIEKVVLLVGFIIVSLYLLMVKYVSSFFSDLGYKDDAKLKAAYLRVIIYDLLPKTEGIEIKYM